MWDYMEGVLRPVWSSYFLPFQTLDCLLNLEPSRQYNKSSCKCLNRGLLDFGVPTPRPQEDCVFFHLLVPKVVSLQAADSLEKSGDKLSAHLGLNLAHSGIHGGGGGWNVAVGTLEDILLRNRHLEKHKYIHPSVNPLVCFSKWTKCGFWRRGWREKARFPLFFY